jgi:hypothetical protein
VSPLEFLPFASIGQANASSWPAWLARRAASGKSSLGCRGRPTNKKATASNGGATNFRELHVRVECCCCCWWWCCCGGLRLAACGPHKLVEVVCAPTYRGRDRHEPIESCPKRARSWQLVVATVRKRAGESPRPRDGGSSARPRIHGRALGATITSQTCTTVEECPHRSGHRSPLRRRRSSASHQLVEGRKARTPSIRKTVALRAAGQCVRGGAATEFEKTTSCWWALFTPSASLLAWNLLPRPSRRRLQR